MQLETAMESLPTVNQFRRLSNDSRYYHASSAGQINYGYSTEAALILRQESVTVADFREEEIFDTDMLKEYIQEQNFFSHSNSEPQHSDDESSGCHSEAFIITARDPRASLKPEHSCLHLTNSARPA